MPSGTATRPPARSRRTRANGDADVVDEVVLGEEQHALLHHRDRAGEEGGDTKPPSVEEAQTTTKSTKKPSPSSQRARAPTGSSGALGARGA